MRKKLVIGLVLVLVSVAAVIGISYWNKSHESVWDAKVYYSGTIEAFPAYFFTNPDSLALQWQEGAVSLTGTAPNVSGSSVLEFTTGNGLISCAMAEGVSLPAVGQQIELRGFFSGYDLGLPGFADLPPSISLIRCEWKAKP